MATSYLDRFRSGLRAIQSKQILALLNREKDRGNITSIEEFKVRLQELTSKLSSTHLSPTLELFLGQVEDIIDSDSYNFMLERIQDDLEAAFQEANDIDEVLSAHETIISDVVLKNIELAIDELESKIESLEFINTTQLGFDNADFNTFRITQNNRSGTNREVLFIDPKTGASNNEQGEAFIDHVGEKLLLRTSLIEDIRIEDIRLIHDYEATSTELEVDHEDSDIRNVIDQRAGTHWIYSTLLSSPRGEEGVVTKVELDLGTFKTINTLEIEPLLNFPVELENIHYLTIAGEAKPILLNPVPVHSTNKLLFNAVATNKLILKFINKNYKSVQFRTRSNSLVGEGGSYEELVASLADELQETVSNPRLLEALQIPESIALPRSYYEYSIGFDNIRVGLNKFSEVSIFVGPSLKRERVGELALRVNERRPFSDNGVTEYTTVTYPVDKTNLFLGSLEYYCIKKDYSLTDALLNTSVFPLLPLNASQVRHERLYLTERSNSTEALPSVGHLQFFTLAEDITVYRNGIPLPDATGNPSIVDGWVKHELTSLSVPNQPRPMRYSIRIQKPNSNHLYTVSYTPALSTADYISPENTSASFTLLEGLRYVDLTGKLDAWLGKNNIVRFRPVKNGTPISYSVLNLVVVLRRNSANINLTPVLEDYLLATGTINEEKFQ